MLSKQGEGKMKIVRNLSEELHNPQAQALQQGAEDQLTCALKQKLSCCDGVGYRLDHSGPYTQAKLCECVTSCPTCFGRVRHLENGVSVPCREPNPSRVVNILNSAGIPNKYGPARLDQFTNMSGNGRDVLANVRQWLGEFHPRKSKGLLIGGSIGVGKTYLIVALAKNIAARGYTVKFVDFFQLLSELKAGYANDQADASILSPLNQVDVLFIDEMGKGRNTDWEISILDQMIMSRYNQGKIIVATTNYDLHPQRKGGSMGLSGPLDDGLRSGFNPDRFESLQVRVGERIFSRLTEMCRFIELTGEDYRVKLSRDNQNLFASSGAGRRADERPMM